MPAPDLPEDHDVLGRQLAHLDAMERRGLLHGASHPVDGPPDAPPPPAAPTSRSRDLPPPPPADGSVERYLTWVEQAGLALAERVAANSGELERLTAQWAHVLLNVHRLDRGEIDAVHEGQARLREAIASDVALHDSLRRHHEQLLAWVRTPEGPVAGRVEPGPVVGVRRP